MESKDGYSLLWMPSNVETFARKILRIFGELTKEDVENEVAVISQVCISGKSNTVVEVYEHGWLPGLDLSYYYLDMEYCSETLEERIHRTAKHESFASIHSSTQAIELSSTAAAVLSATAEFTWEQTVDILMNICSGLQYLHEQELVHRDLKPRNGALPS